jgi:Protein of unknown function (DUF1549)/Protein of unknown function (DUF1553)
MTKNLNSRHRFRYCMGAIVLGCFVLAMTHDGEAQTKKAKDKDKDKEPTKAKVEPPPTTFPAHKDIIETAYGTAEQVAFIDEQIAKGWKDNKTYPSERCTDHEFIRRVSLDIIGRIPTVEEIGTFMSHPEMQRRSWLISAMLDGKEYGEGREYAQNFANMWTVNLMTRTGSGRHYQDQMNAWLYDQFKTGDDTPPNSKELQSGTADSSKEKTPVKEKKVEPKTSTNPAPDWSKTAYQLIAGKGDTNRNAAVNYLLHNLGEEIKQDGAKNGKWDMVPATSRTTRLFLGIRTQCVQCHDHPFNGEWSQVDFWGINAFLRQVETKGTQGNARPLMMAKKKNKGEKGNEDFTVSDNKNFNATGMIGYERRNATLFFADPTFLDGQKIPEGFKGTRREMLAKFVTTSPFFAKAYVNRTWGHFMGMSFIRGPVDDFYADNRISHEKLLEKLSTDWAKNYGHNPKVLIRWICNSQAYGLSSRANKWNDRSEDESLFARMLLKPMTPEQLFASVTVANNYKWHKYTEEKKSKKLEGGAAWYAKLTTNFGNDEGEEGTYTGSVVQALMMMNGQDINQMIADKDDGTAEWVYKNRGKILVPAIQEMFLHVLNRPATDKEVKDMMRPDMISFRPGSKTQPNTPEFWKAYYQDVMWALLNSNEFILNH